ncbi:MAG: hypothetical protein NVSMB64_11360 [Candidatus Velthaea sp.]
MRRPLYRVTLPSPNRLERFPRRRSLARRYLEALMAALARTLAAKRSEAAVHLQRLVRRMY